nr:hypothetical protein [Limnohabitans sp.]
MKFPYYKVKKNGYQVNVFGSYRVGKFSLFPAFCSVVHPAKHLAIVEGGFAAFVPRDDMASFHGINIKVLFASRADTFLLLINFLLNLVVEGPQTQGFLVTCFLPYVNDAANLVCLHQLRIKRHQFLGHK